MWRRHFSLAPQFFIHSCFHQITFVLGGKALTRTTQWTSQTGDTWVTMPESMWDHGKHPAFSLWHRMHLPCMKQAYLCIRREEFESLLLRFQKFFLQNTFPTKCWTLSIKEFNEAFQGPQYTLGCWRHRVLQKHQPSRLKSSASVLIGRRNLLHLINLTLIMSCCRVLVDGLCHSIHIPSLFSKRPATQVECSVDVRGPLLMFCSCGWLLTALS